MFKKLLLPTLFFINACSAAEPTQLHSGIYEGLLLAVDPAGYITGYYQESQGAEPAKNCSFYLQGQIGKNQNNVATWNTESFPGTLSAEADGVKLQIAKGRDHPGCASVLLPQISAGLSLDLTAETKWKELRRIKIDRAYFYQEANDTQKLKPYVIKGNIVGVISSQGEWDLVEYKTDKKTFKGWINTNATAKFEPPK